MAGAPSDVPGTVSPVQARYTAIYSTGKVQQER
jgi:hypothetical protein